MSAMAMLAVNTLAGLAAFACVFAMGFAIQQGGTCTVAAIDEIVAQRRARRLYAMLEASLWVAGGLAIAKVLQMLPTMPAGYAITEATVFGGMLLGLGAWVAGACVFGAIARFGSGQWAFMLTPVGFYLGCASVGWLFFGPAPGQAATRALLLDAAPAAALLFALYALARIVDGWPVVRAMRVAHRPAAIEVRARLRAFGVAVWTPHLATVTIGISFVLTLLLAGRWAYTELLADLAHGQWRQIGFRLWLLLALLLGAVYGGWRAGRLRSQPITARQAARCLIGGVLMGWGTLTIPGANDTLVLIGLPLLLPHAWFAFATMCASIAVALIFARALSVREVRAH